MPARALNSRNGNMTKDEYLFYRKYRSEVNRKNREKYEECCRKAEERKKKEAEELGIPLDEYKQQLHDKKKAAKDARKKELEAMGVYAKKKEERKKFKGKKGRKLKDEDAMRRLGAERDMVLAEYYRQKEEENKKKGITEEVKPEPIPNSIPKKKNNPPKKKPEQVKKKVNDNNTSIKKSKSIIVKEKCIIYIDNDNEDKIVDIGTEYINRDIDSFINLFKTNKDINEIFVSEWDYAFSTILASKFNGVLYYDDINEHFVCKIDNDYFDANGKYENTVNLHEWNQYRKDNFAVCKKVMKERVYKYE